MIAVDFGIKYNQIRCLIDCDCQVLVVPWNYDYFDLLKNKGLLYENKVLTTCLYKTHLCLCIYV